ncbi:MAG: hypothetical protein U0822_20890 [Anaerolineae bacterium]
MNSPSSPPTVSAAFLDALGQRDFDRLSTYFHPAPRARLLTPSALAMPPDASGVGDRFQLWFGEADEFEVEHAEVSEVGGCLSIRYRLRLHNNRAWYTCEQQVYCRVKDGLVERIDLLCSGFQPIPGPAPIEEKVGERNA